MKAPPPLTAPLPHGLTGDSAARPPIPAPRDVVRYYTEAGIDYDLWSRAGNMHFGYFRRGLNPLHRESMLREMNRQVGRRLELPVGPSRLIDLGCGTGATARQLAGEHPRLAVEGISLVPHQIERARHDATTQGLGDRLGFTQANFAFTPFPPAVADGVIALESLCHDRGLAKPSVIAEAARLLKPGGRFVIADGFLVNPERMGPVLRWCLRQACRGWALDTLPGLEAVRQALTDHGFETVTVEDISARIAPTALHTPWVTAKWLVKELLRPTRTVTRRRRDHVLACVVAPFIGLHRRHFRYCLITARKAD